MEENNDFQIVTEHILIPGQKCGLIIGRNGETIKNMQETIGVKMLFIQENRSISNQPKPLQITGTTEKIAQAKQAIQLLLANDENNRMGNSSMSSSSFGGGMMNQQFATGEVLVPRAVVGTIIGKGGETIKRLAQQTRTKIQFNHDNDPMLQERIATIQGTHEQIEIAAGLIWNLIQAANAPHEKCLMYVPSSRTGLVIGRGGEGLRAIRNESGAQIDLPKDNQTNDEERIFTITGTPYQIHVARHLIQIRVGKIPPGTPVPEFQPDQNVQPSVNPSTGELDYSAQWIEYYRSLGMHDHVAAIEEQLECRELE